MSPAAPLAWSRLRADGDRSRLATLLLVVDGEGRDVLAGRGEAEDLGVEVELRVERVLDVLGLVRVRARARARARVRVRVRVRVRLSYP